MNRSWVTAFVSLISAVALLVAVPVPAGALPVPGVRVVADQGRLWLATETCDFYFEITEVRYQQIATGERLPTDRIAYAQGLAQCGAYGPFYGFIELTGEHDKYGINQLESAWVDRVPLFLEWEGYFFPFEISATWSASGAPTVAVHQNGVLLPATGPFGAGDHEYSKWVPSAASVDILSAGSPALNDTHVTGAEIHTLIRTSQPPGGATN